MPLRAPAAAPGVPHSQAGEGMACGAEAEVALEVAEEEEAYKVKTVENLAHFLCGL